MSRHNTRTDKTCLNCRHVVQDRFCPNCGQENIESRKTFYELFVHFFEDLTHYENAFWRTIRNLLLKPASLTIEYLSGKRLSYLAPVRLYIFISFVTFFLISVIPDVRLDDSNSKQNDTNSPRLSKTTIYKKELENSQEISLMIDKPSSRKDETTQSTSVDQDKKNKEYQDLFQFGYKSMQEVDSIQKYGSTEDRLDSFEYWLVKKAFEVTSKSSTEEIIEKFKESFARNFPKTIFLYMPIFAFFLWLFQSKKRWYYFDHGIFTLHYFSFLLLIGLSIFLCRKLFSLFSSNYLLDTIENIFDFAAIIWMFYYFFPAHHRFYGESRLVSALKSIALFIINVIIIMMLQIFFAIYTFLNIH